MQLRAQELHNRSPSGVVIGREDLCSAKLGLVMTGGCAGRNELPVRTDLGEGRADVGDPAQRLERDVAGMADHEEPLQAACRAVEPQLAALSADAVLDDEVTSLNVELDAVAVGDDGAAGRGGSLELHAKP